MERFITNTLAFPSSSQLSEQDYHKELKALYEYLCKLQAQTLAGTRDNDPLELLDNQANSLGVLFVLLARINIDKNEITSLWPRIIDFLSEFDGRQTRPAREHLIGLVKLFLSFCEHAGKPILAIKPLQNVISQINYPSGPKLFSPLHTKFVKKCLDARCFRAALPILNIDVEEFPPKAEKELSYRDHLQYFLHGAMIYMAMKKWRRASEFLHFVISCPGSHVSQIQVEAFKKFVLVTLLIEGRGFQFPKTIPGNNLKLLRTLSKPYEAFATAYSTGNPDILRREAVLVAEIFQADGNWGLAQRCLENFRRLGIQALTHTYSTLSVSTIASRDLNVQDGRNAPTSPEDLEQYILDMIDRKEVKASLSHLPTSDDAQSLTSCMVSFHDLPSLETDILKDLEVQIARTVQITVQARLLDKKLGLSKEWISYTGKKGRGAPGGAAEHVDQGYEEMDDFRQAIDLAALAEAQGYNGDFAGYDPADDEMQMRPDYND